ncbi:hypothetical protein HPB50_013684 [Hyalomma asiaticum]|uniref:Uncharacterized protein n=1 Tax=Hyalomma asiaticum TaxID=266040 RepID=A0ACB7TH24_HYAAI|nr:hypothetical protein HPB50_013684 [Hyalomma asiaticum]
MSIHTLLQAAEYIERREREAEHGYASTMPIPVDLPKKKPKAKKTQGNRSAELGDVYLLAAQPILEIA